MNQAFDPYLFFSGNCAEAMRFYESTLGGKIEMMMKHGDMPGPDGQPSKTPDLIMHGRLAVNGRILMASDWMADVPFDGQRGVSISLMYDDVADASRVFAALAEGGRVTMPIQKTFWIELFGSAIDRFGTSWMVNGGKPPEGFGRPA